MIWFYLFLYYVGPLAAGLAILWCGVRIVRHAWKA